MSILVEPYNPVHFRNIPDFPDAIALSKEKDARSAVDALGKIFLKHKAHNKYGLAIVHRHFDMSEDEILVETIHQENRVSVAMPWKISGNTCSPSPTDKDYWNTFDFTHEKYVRPCTWAFGQDDPGTLIPFEFMTTNELEEEETPNEEFVQELFQALKTMGLANIFGLRRVRMNKSPSYETTPEGMRANIVKFEKIPQEMRGADFETVVFYIDESGKVKLGDWCIVHTGTCHHCGAHCRNHK